MMQAKPRGIDGIDFEARLLAQDAAKQAGLSLRQWLDEVVATHASKLGVDVEELDSDRRLEIIAAKLGNLGNKNNSTRTSEWSALQNRSETLRESVSRRRWRDRELDDSPAPPKISDRSFADADARHGSVEAPHPSRRSIRDLERMAEGELDEAIAMRERNGRTRETRTAEALADVTHWIPRNTSGGASGRNALDVIADRLARIDQYVAHRRDDEGYEPSRMRLDQLEDRVRSIAHEIDPTAQLPAEQSDILDDLGDRLTDVTDKIDRLERAGSPRERAEHFAKFGSQLGTILASLERQLAKPSPPASVPEPAPVRAANVPSTRRPGFDRRAGSLNSIDTAVAEIAKRQRALDDGDEPTRSEGQAADPGGWRHGAGQRQELPGSQNATAVADPGIDVAAFDQRLETIALRIERAMQRRDDARVPPIATSDIEAMRSEIAEIGRSVAELTDASARGSASTVAGIQGEIARLATRMERALSADREPEADVLRHEIQEMSRVIADLAATNARKEASSVSTLQSEIAKLASQLGQPRSEQPNADIQQLRGEVSELSTRLSDVLSRGPISTLETAVRDLSARVETSRDEGVREGLLAPVERLANEMRAALRDLDPRPTVEALDGEIRKIGYQLDEMSRRDFDAGTVNRIQEQTREIRDLLAAAAQRPMPLQHIEAQIAALGERLEEVATHRTTGGDLAARSNDIRALLKDALPADIVSTLEHRLETLTERVEEALARPGSEHALDALNSRVERLHQALSQQPGAGDTRALETMVRRLADAVEEIRDSGTDSRAIAAIEGQIDKILSRLDKSDAGFASLGALERSMGDLFSKLEDSRNSAEAAARSAVREAMEAGGADTRSVRPQVENISRELADLHGMHDEADRRIHATLSAVHGTLEKVVDRLAMLDEEPLPGARRQAMPEQTPPSEPKSAEPPRRQPAPPLAEPTADRPAMRPASTAAAPPIAAHAATPGAAARLAEAEIDQPDFLIEPGTGARPGSAPVMPRERLVPAAGRAAEQPASSSFIAAARRAAQAAAAESAAATASRSRDRHEGREAVIASGAAGPAEQVKAFLAAKKRPLLLGVAGLVVVLGAYGIFHGFTSAQNEPATATPPAAAAKEQPQPRTQLEAPASPAPGKQSSAPDASKAGANLLDPTPTGSVATPGGIPHFDGSGIGAPRGMALRDAALQGNPAAQYEMGARLAEGRLMPRDLKAASQWFEKAAAQGLAPGQYRLGALYEKGSGVPQDMTLAVAWYQRAAEAGNARAMHNLAVITAEGATNGKPNYATAVSWFRKAAALGIRDSQYNLAILTARGLGTTQDLPESYMWFSLAALQGDVDAGKKRDEVAKQLDAPTLASAKERVEGFKPQPLNRSANIVAAPPGGWDGAPSLSRGVMMPRAKVSGL